MNPNTDEIRDLFLMAKKRHDAKVTQLSVALSLIAVTVMILWIGWKF